MEVVKEQFNDSRVRVRACDNNNDILAQSISTFDTVARGFGATPQLCGSNAAASLYLS